MLEYEGKRLLRSVGVRVPEGALVGAAAEVDGLSLSYPVAVKAQVRSGGRGKAGGVVRAEDAGAAKAAVARLMASAFDGERPASVLVEPWVAAERELYLSVTVDGGAGGYVVLFSPRGGVEIEGGAPPLRYDVGAPAAFRAHRLREILAAAEPDAAVREGVVRLARLLLRLAATRDCTTVEINPLFVLAEGALVAADAKIVRDEWAAFRDGEIAALIAEDRRHRPEAIRRCLEAGLMLVPLEGEIGLISGGAGMTMAAMDLIARAGGRPACFLDCSANPTPAGYRLSFDLLESDPGVKVILVSIFGGATQMERVARVMVDIVAARTARKPVVFRLNGTNAEEADETLKRHGLDNHATLEGAVAAAMALAGGGR